MQPSHAWARTHTTQSPHATAASCHHWQPVTAIHLGLGRAIGRQRTTCAFYLLLFGSTGDQENAAGKKGQSGKKGCDGGCPGQLEINLLEFFSFAIGGSGRVGLPRVAPWLVPSLSHYLAAMLVLSPQALPSFDTPRSTSKEERFGGCATVQTVVLGVWQGCWQAVASGPWATCNMQWPTDNGLGGMRHLYDRMRRRCGLSYFPPLGRPRGADVTMLLFWRHILPLRDLENVNRRRRPPVQSRSWRPNRVSGPLHLDLLTR